MKKGFTLIELLAVIVILAIIALIATPIILGIINDAKEDSEKRSIENYAHAVELSVARYASGNDGVVPVGKYKATGKILTNIDASATPNQLEIDYKGEEIDATVEITADGQVIITGAKIGNGKNEYDYSESNGVTKNESDEVESSEINMISFNYNYDEEIYIDLFYYKGSGDVVLDNANIVRINERAFMKNNVFVIEYEISDGICGSGSCPEKVILFVLDKSIEEDLRNYYANNSLNYEVEVIVPKTSKEIEEKFFEIENNEKNNVSEVFPAYYVFENGELNEEAIGYETNITSIDLSNLVNELEIDYNAFAYMTSLKTVKLPINMQRIDDKWFNGNTSLEKIVIPYKEGEIKIKDSWWNYDEVLGKYHTVEYGTLINENKYAS